MARIQTHLKVFLSALVFGMGAYGIVQLGIALHRYIIS
jgi:hypothetical protein